MSQPNNPKGRRKPINTATDELSGIMGSATGESEYCNASGGWAGTDDDASTAPSDQIGNPPTREEDKSVSAINKDMNAALQQDDEEALPFNSETD